ncbi:hypothetical protein THTE_2174 [Thermogutta terrifontis]|uniref:Uncharacterized protein n=1 Tax=Thermogutta terrifontis TaxID=1331910 RepID=A0A286RFP4_9BACT|nr:hypothetical protein THTE_2174 [Thermogutta terrifontis]
MSDPTRGGRPIFASLDKPNIVDQTAKLLHPRPATRHCS